MFIHNNENKCSPIFSFIYVCVHEERVLQEYWSLRALRQPSCLSCIVWVHVETTINRYRFFGRVSRINQCIPRRKGIFTRWYILVVFRHLCASNFLILKVVEFSSSFSSSSSSFPLRCRSSRAQAGSGIASSVGPGATTLADGDGGVQQPGTEPRRWMNRAAVCRIAHTYAACTW